MQKPLRLAYFGSGQFAVPPLEALLKRPGNFRLMTVVCQPDRPVGRERRLEACPVGRVALPSDVPLWQPEKVRGNQEFLERIRNLDLDLAVVASYGQILPDELLKTARLGFLNLHGSLLPKWRGASPIQAAIRSGDRKTGVTLMLMDEKMDHGPILKQAELEIAPNETQSTLEGRLAQLASAMTDDILLFAEGRLTPQAQDHTQATFCRTLTRRDGLIVWQEESAEEIERKLRAFTPWPGLYALWPRAGQPLRLKVLAVSLTDSHSKQEPGTVALAESGSLAVVAADHRLIEITEAQMAGRKPCAGQALTCGYRELIGSKLASSEQH